MVKIHYGQEDMVKGFSTCSTHDEIARFSQMFVDLENNPPYTRHTLGIVYGAFTARSVPT